MKNNEAQALLDTLRREDKLREMNPLAANGKLITSDGHTYLNLASNDYLGLTDNSSTNNLGLSGTALQKEFFKRLGNEPDFFMSNPSSRLMTGNTPHYETLERAIAKLYPGQRTALTMGSGFAANSGAIGALTEKGDLVIADKASHASIIDGMRLCEADWLRFRHNDMEHLEDIVRKNRHRYRSVWVVTESVFSMDGDRCPLREIVELKERYDLQIMLDEAHTVGVVGPNGAGMAVQLGLSEQIDVIVGTMSKAIASTGGFIITDTPTRELLVNRMRTLIYSTALPSINLMWSTFLIEHMAYFEPRRRHLAALAEALTWAKGSSQIVPVMVPGNDKVMEMARRFKQNGLWASAIRHPTVQAGSERLRLTLSAAMTLDEVASIRALCDEFELNPGL